MKESFIFSIVLIIAIIAIIAIFIIPHFVLNSPPSISDVQYKFNKNYDEIKLISEYLINQQYKNVYVLEANGTMRADFVDIEIQNSKVKDAIETILKNGNYKCIYKYGNTIYLIQWKGLQDIGCGIAYTINGIDLPNISYMTQCVPLSEDNWYYYVSKG